GRHALGRPARRGQARRRGRDAGAGVLMTFLTPWAGIIVTASVFLPLTALALAERRLELARRLLGLHDPGSAGRGFTIAALIAIPLLLGLAAAQPVIRRDHGRAERTDAQAVFVLDISRSI